MNVSNNEARTHMSKSLSTMEILDKDHKPVGTISNEGKIESKDSKLMKMSGYDSSWDAKNAVLAKGYGIRSTYKSVEIELPEDKSLLNIFDL